MTDKREDSGVRLVFSRDGPYVTAACLIPTAIMNQPERMVIGAIAAAAFEQMPAVKAQFIAVMKMVATDVMTVRTGRAPQSWDRHLVVEPPAGGEIKN